MVVTVSGRDGADDKAGGGGEAGQGAAAGRHGGGRQQPAGGGPVSRTVWSALYYAQYWTACGGRILRYEPEDSLHGQLSKEVDLKLAAQQLNLAQLV